MKKFLGLVFSLTIISAVCAAVLAHVGALTKEPIAKIGVEREKSAVQAVMPDGVVKIEEKNSVFIGLSSSGAVAGYATEGVDAGGYGGDIKLMVGFESDGKTVIRYKTLFAAETPGLGMKLNDQQFASQFGGKDGAKVKVRKEGGNIEAITAATITSSAVCRAVKNAQKKVASVK